MKLTKRFNIIKGKNVFIAPKWASQNKNGFLRTKMVFTEQ